MWVVKCIRYSFVTHVRFYDNLCLYLFYLFYFFFAIFPPATIYLVQYVNGWRYEYELNTQYSLSQLLLRYIYSGNTPTSDSIRMCGSEPANAYLYAFSCLILYGCSTMQQQPPVLRFFMHHAHLRFVPKCF